KNFFFRFFNFFRNVVSRNLGFSGIIRLSRVLISIVQIEDMSIYLLRKKKCKKKSRSTIIHFFSKYALHKPCFFGDYKILYNSYFYSTYRRHVYSPFEQKKCKKCLVEQHSLFFRNMVSRNLGFSGIIRLSRVLIFIVHIEDMSIHLLK